jgi:hypothetical protein
MSFVSYFVVSTEGNEQLKFKEVVCGNVVFRMDDRAREEERERDNSFHMRGSFSGLRYSFERRRCTFY